MLNLISFVGATFSDDDRLVEGAVVLVEERSGRILRCVSHLIDVEPDPDGLPNERGHANSGLSAELVNLVGITHDRFGRQVDKIETKWFPCDSARDFVTVGFDLHRTITSFPDKFGGLGVAGPVCLTVLWKFVFGSAMLPSMRHLPAIHEAIAASQTLANLLDAGRLKLDRKDNGCINADGTVYISVFRRIADSDEYESGFIVGKADGDELPVWKGV